MLAELLTVATGLYLVAAASLAAFEAPYPACVELGSPLAYREIFIHVPVAIATYAAFTAAFIAALYYLARGSRRAAEYAHRAVGVGLILAIATLLTGSSWAAESWGSPWNWDPRETGVLLLALAFAAYYAVRRSILDPERAERIGMAYIVAAWATLPISFLAPYLFPSLHPTVVQTAHFIMRAATPFKALFYSSYLAAIIFAVSAPAARRLGRAGIAAALVALLISAGAAATLAYGYAACNKLGRVESAALKEGVIVANVTIGGEVVRVELPASQSPIKPAYLTGAAAAECWRIAGGGRGPWVTLVGHVVCLSPLRVLPPPCIPFSVLLVGLAVAGVLIYSSRGGGAAKTGEEAAVPR